MPTPTRVHVTTDGEGVALSRELFLTAEPSDASRVRPAILASWQRSRDRRVAADKIDLRYLRDPDIDTPLTRSAEPVLRGLGEQLGNQAVSIILTDPTGLVLSRRTADAELDRHLDRVLLAPGFSYAEEYVGTNGIGTALEAGTATHVFGHEHYAENLEDLACAGVPIRHPISGGTVGVVDLTCWRKDAASLLLTLAKSTAAQIQQALLAESGLRDLELLKAYRRTCRQISGIVFAVTSDAVMLNDHARAMLSPAEQALLLAQAAEAAEEVAPGSRWSAGVMLPTGTPARMYFHQIPSDGRPAGVVVHVKLGESETSKSTHDSSSQMLLPGLVGQSPLWLRACHDVERASRAGEWLAVQGEPGVGKIALLRAVQLRTRPSGRLEVFDAADASTSPDWFTSLGKALAGGSANILVAHIDKLDGRGRRAFSAALQTVRASERHQGPWVAVTLGRSGDAKRKELSQVLRLFPTTVEAPALRLHLEDLEQLVPFFLARLGHGGRRVCSSEAMSLLMRSSWPGNVEQLHQLLRQVTQRRRSGVIRPHDLPPEAQTVSRRRLSALESLERDAVVNALSDTGGNKLKAASSLGMSRATIYRKIHEYGIVVPPTPAKQ